MPTLVSSQLRRWPTLAQVKGRRAHGLRHFLLLARWDSLCNAAQASLLSACMAHQSAAHPRAVDAPVRRFWPLALGALGVVYGDIGTSPIYAFREAVVAASGDTGVVPGSVLGIL